MREFEGSKYVRVVRRRTVAQFRGVEMSVLYEMNATRGCSHFVGIRA